MQKLAAIFVSLMLLAGLAACGGGGEESTTSDGASSDSGSSGSSGSDTSSGSGSSSSGGSASGSTSSDGSAQTSAVGYGYATTGAGSSPGTTVTVTTLAEAQAAVSAYQTAGGTAGLKIIYNGTFDFDTIPDPCTQHSLDAQILEFKGTSSKPAKNITLIGTDGSAANWSIKITGLAQNIIIRNMTIGLPPGGDASDIVGVEGTSNGIPQDIWIDHNTFFSSMVECDGAGDTEFDGMIDFKKGATNVTVSYNYLHDHHKTSLNGYSDDDTATRSITFHHNIFENLGSRTPLQRGGYSHIFSNLFSTITTSGINVRMSGYSLIESNYFTNVKNPVTSRDSSEVGYWQLRNNNITSSADFTTYGITWSSVSGSGEKNADDWASTATFPTAQLTYSYTVDTPACVYSGLRAVAGAGKSLATLTCS